jgi:hypothetical protein
MKTGLKVALFLALFALLVPLAAANEGGADGGQEHPRGPRKNLEQIAENWGIDLETLKEKLESGQTLREIAEELGIPAPEKPPVDWNKNKPPKFKVMEALAEEVGVSMEEIGEAFKNGTSLPEIAASYGLDFKTWVQATFPVKEESSES